MFTEEPTHVLYCYSIHQKLFDRMEVEIPNFTLHQGLPSTATLDQFCDNGDTHKLIIADDMMSDIVASKEACKLITEGCHHRRVSSLIISHNLFTQGPCAKTIALNTHILVLFKAMRSAGQINHLGRQVFPHNPRAISESYTDCMKQRHGYLVVDLSPFTINDEYRLRTHIFPDEQPTIVYSLR